MTEGDSILAQLRSIEAAGEAQLMRDGERAGRPLVERVLANLAQAAGFPPDSHA